ncbi:MAG: Uma2 family endonuclease [Longimicrobiaceae bacterium]
MTTETLAPAVSTERISFEDFLRAYDGMHAEWVDGSVVPMSPVSDRHQDIVDFLAALLRHLVEATDAGIIRTSQIAMHLERSARVPDILFLSAEHLDRRKETFVEGAADLVIEVTSPESRGRDRGEKFYEYEQGGVAEYWLIDPARKSVDLFRRDEHGYYEAVSTPTDTRLESAVLRGFWIDPVWLWSDPIPKLDYVLKEWGLR